MPGYARFGSRSPDQNHFTSVLLSLSRYAQPVCGAAEVVDRVVISAWLLRAAWCSYVPFVQLLSEVVVICYDCCACCVHVLCIYVSQVVDGELLDV